MFGEDFTQLHRSQSKQKEEEEVAGSIIHPWNFFEQSDFALNRSFPVQTFSGLHSLTVRQVDFKDMSQVRLSEGYSQDRDCFRYIDQYDPFFVMPFQRGTSEAAELVEAKITNPNRSLQIQCQKSIENHQIEHEQTILNTWESPVTSHFVKQELKSSSHIRQTQKPINKQQSTNKGFLTKNVSKNMGKLLLKFIWKNRELLQSQLNVDYELWRSFLSLIVVWKKENNITRQFFTRKWISEGQEYKIFRILANHFFRKHCHCAILKSNIKEKQLHIEKISKFRRSISEPAVLSSLV